MAIQAGLTMQLPILPRNCWWLVHSLDMLLCKEESALRYIEYAGTCTGIKPVSSAAQTTETSGQKEKNLGRQPSGNGVSGSAASGEKSPGETLPFSAVYEAVLKGNRSGIEQITRRALEEGASARSFWIPVCCLLSIRSESFLIKESTSFPADFQRGSHEIIYRGFLEPFLSSDGKQEKMPVVVIATVEGDIHDIGKNLVALMLRNYGFEVIDLGKDVPKEKIIQAAKEHGAGIIGLSALMTTTMQEMRHVVELAHEEGLDSKIIIGGAVVTQDYADEIHADGLCQRCGRYGEAGETAAWP